MCLNKYVGKALKTVLQWTPFKLIIAELLIVLYYDNLLRRFCAARCCYKNEEILLKFKYEKRSCMYNEAEMNSGNCFFLYKK